MNSWDEQRGSTACEFLRGIFFVTLWSCLGNNESLDLSKASHWVEIHYEKKRKEEVEEESVWPLEFDPTRLEELWRVSTDDLTRQVWKSCDLLSVPMTPHYSSQRFVTFHQYRWSHTIRLKELWRVICTDDLTRHVWKSCDVVSVLMISHDTSERVVTCCQYHWSHTARLKEVWAVVSTDDFTRHVSINCYLLLIPMILHHTSKRVVTWCQYQWSRSEDEQQNDKSLRLLVLTAVIVVDVADHWLPSRVVQVAGRLQAAAVVVNKGRARTGQAVHRHLLQQNFVADPGVSGVSSSTPLVHRECLRTGGSVMRQLRIGLQAGYRHRLWLYSTCSSSSSSSGSGSVNRSDGGGSRVVA